MLEYLRIVQISSIPLMLSRQFVLLPAPFGMEARRPASLHGCNYKAVKAPRQVLVTIIEDNTIVLHVVEDSLGTPILTPSRCSSNLV
jgi:hypothetical protein